MHGRVKVKTTEQQDREKKLERDAKLASYRKVHMRNQCCSDPGSGAFFTLGSGPGYVSRILGRELIFLRA
jgi:hypothetical protein